jgi:hypothetical protein
LSAANDPRRRPKICWPPKTSAMWLTTIMAGITVARLWYQVRLFRNVQETSPILRLC